MLSEGLFGLARFGGSVFLWRMVVRSQRSVVMFLLGFPMFAARKWLIGLLAVVTLAGGLLVLDGRLSASEPAGSGVASAPMVSSEEGHGSAMSEISHAFASEQQEDPMQIGADLALWTLVVFLMLCAALYATAWKPIAKGLQDREQGIAKQIEDARRASEEAKAKLAEYQVKLDEAARQSQEMIAQARKDAEVASQRMLADASAEATRIKDRAIADIDSAKAVALSELGQKSADIAFSLARGIVGRELKTSDHQQLVQDALRSMPSKN